VWRAAAPIEGRVHLWLVSADAEKTDALTHDSRPERRIGGCLADSRSTSAARLAAKNRAKIDARCGPGTVGAISDRAQTDAGIASKAVDYRICDVAEIIIGGNLEIYRDRRSQRASTKIVTSCLKDGGLGAFPTQPHSLRPARRNCRVWWISSAAGFALSHRVPNSYFGVTRFSPCFRRISCPARRVFTQCR